MSKALNPINFLGLGVSLACLAYVLASLDLKRLWSLATEVPPLYFLGVNVIMAGVLWVRALRWQLLLEPVRHCRTGQLYSVSLIGLLANNLFPARLGELVRAYTADHLCRVPMTSALATMLLEYLLDGLITLLVLFVTLMHANPQAQAGAFSLASMRAAGGVLLLVFLGLLSLLAALWRWPEVTMERLSRLLGRFSPRLARAVELRLASFSQGLAVLSQARRFPRLIAYSLLIWLATLASYVMFLPALGLPANLFLGAMAFSGAALAVVLPAAPGMVGTLQLGVMWGMMLAGADQERAAAYSLILWAANYVPLTCAGIFELWRSGLTLSMIRRWSTRG